MGFKWLTTGTRALAIGINQGGAASRASLPGSTTPDIQFHFATLSADDGRRERRIPWPGCTFSVCQLPPGFARHRSRIKSAIPCEAPSMRPNFLSAQTDRACAVDRHADRAPIVADARRSALHRLASTARRRGADLRRVARLRPRHTARRSSTRRHLQDGLRSDGGGRRPAAGARASPALRVVDCLDHADAVVRQHQCAGDHDRRESRRHDPRGRAGLTPWRREARGRSPAGPAGPYSRRPIAGRLSCRKSTSPPR